VAGAEDALRDAVAAAERNQADWLAATARATGGGTWSDGPLRWAHGRHSGEVLLLFPRELPAAALARGLAVAGERGARRIGCWLAADVDPRPLARHGFTRGWDPHWMAATIAALPAAADARVALEPDTPEYDADGRGLLTLTAARPARTWHATARLDGALAGRAWAHRTGAVAGVYDVEVWPHARRRGLGTALTLAVCAAAGRSGARTAVLNATPDGRLLYAALGFATCGEGRTWWRHER
jgi:ribosomal protein S18 acetylase RimI-like enzyme